MHDRLSYPNKIFFILNTDTGNKNNRRILLGQGWIAITKTTKAALLVRCHLRCIMLREGINGILGTAKRKNIVISLLGTHM